MPAPKRIAVFGSTGSIGTRALEVIEASGGRLQAIALSAHSRLDLLAQQARQIRPRWVIATDPQAAAKFTSWRLPPGVELVVGSEALAQVATESEVDTVLAGIVGSAGLASTWAALEAGKQVALANKETLVMAGPLVRKLLGDNSDRLLPVDSEHSAIFQALASGKTSEVARVVLTASGGPFRTWPAEQLSQVTIDEALAHPTWQMGRKITVDSATMMNKALEIIEARWLFGLPAEKLGVVIHPQSIVHSFVEFIDGSTLAQLSPPDMKLPIQYALDYPHRHNGPTPRLNWRERLTLEFEPPDFQRFPALELGFRCAREGGTSGAVLNAANEAAVASFLEGDLHFTEIVPACRSVLDSHSYQADPTLERLLELDAWAREEIQSWVYA